MGLNWKRAATVLLSGIVVAAMTPVFAAGGLIGH